jgi:ACS family hexuronate transporter-like MFS transporter
VEYGNIVTAFQVAYAIGLLGFGRVIDRIGTKRGYSIAIVIWSLAAMGHALARSVFGFGVARFALGIGEAGNFPAAIKAVAEWFPKKERALATGIFNSGSNVGAIVAPLVVPWLTVRFGWQASFVFLGLLGFVWIIFWLIQYEAPEKKTGLTASECAYILSDPAEGSLEKVPWMRLLAYRQAWAVIVGMTLTAPGWWFYLYWLPKFFHSMTCLGSIGGGLLSSTLIKRGWSINSARKTAMLICALCVVPVIFAAQVSSTWVAVLLIGLAASAHQGWSANLFTLVSDLFPKQAVASVVGLGSMSGSVAAVVFAQSTGFILQKFGSYQILFVVCGCAYLVALAAIQILIPRMEPAVIQSAGSKLRNDS